MSFLDEASQDWSKPELPTLRDLFVLAYLRLSLVEQLADEAGIVPGTFPIADNLRSTWTQLIKVMGNQGRLRALVEKATNDATTAAYSQRFREMLEDNPPVVIPTVGTEEWWKGGNLERLQPQRLMERRSRLVDIELASDVVTAARSVARLRLRFGAKRAFGTAFLVRTDLLLTNHHNVVHPKYGPLTSAVAEFDYDRTPHDLAVVREVAVVPVVADPADDWAVIRLTRSSGRPPLPLGTPYDIGVDDLVVIIQHPLGTFKQFALEPLAIRYADAARLQYVADTQDGSSGSPVFNEHMHIIALHHAESAIDVTVDGRSQTLWRNEGIRIDRVMHGLLEHEIIFDTNT
jgi:Trypsin-like peptidase domain/Effector-associated domain 1